MGSYTIAMACTSKRWGQRQAEHSRHWLRAFTLSASGEGLGGKSGSGQEAPKRTYIRTPEVRGGNAVELVLAGCVPYLPQRVAGCQARDEQVKVAVKHK